MGSEHVVQKGECLSEIANSYGFRSWRTIYDHPKNSDFRAKRPDVNLIYPGDKIYIPQKTSTEAKAQTGKKHTVRVKGGKQKVSFVLGVFDDTKTQEPVKGATVGLMLPGASEVTKHKTDGDGKITLTEPNVTAGTVRVRWVKEQSVVPTLTYLDDETGRPFSTNQSSILHVPDKRRVINAIVKAHSITRRAKWGKQTPKYAQMEEHWGYHTVAIHHSGDGGEKEPTGIEDKHMVQWKWDDVGYHYLVAPDGRIYEGRCLGFKGSHVSKANSYKIGILVMGDFHPQFWDLDDTPTVAQLSSVTALINTIKKHIPALATVGGHRDYNPSSVCPGDTLYNQLDSLRNGTGLAAP